MRVWVREGATVEARSMLGDTRVEEILLAVSEGIGKMWERRRMAEDMAIPAQKVALVEWVIVEAV